VIYYFKLDIPNKSQLKKSSLTDAVLEALQNLEKGSQETIHIDSLVEISKGSPHDVLKKIIFPTPDPRLDSTDVNQMRIALKDLCMTVASIDTVVQTIFLYKVCEILHLFKESSPHPTTKIVSQICRDIREIVTQGMPGANELTDRQLIDAYHIYNQIITS
jgi:hypothetical protein